MTLLFSESDNFRETTLGNITRKDRHGLVDGPFGSSLPASEYTSSGIPVIRGSNLSLGQKRFQTENYVFVSEETANRLSRSLCHPDDIIFTKKGTLGQTGIVPRTEPYKTFLLSSNQMKLSINTEIANPLFVYYYVSSPISRERIVREAMTTGVPKINLEYLRKFPISLPSLPIQHKIAAILSAYDRLIENNTRRIKILEEMAQTLYREWFINFRFPGYEQTKLVNSELGLIPEGWKVRAIGEVIETLGGGTPSTKNPEYWEGGDVLWYTPSDLTSANTMFITKSEKRITALGLQKSSARLFPPYSVMMTSRATVGVVAINVKAACNNQGFITCISNEQLSAYQIYFWIVENKEKIISLASGATFREINKTTFRQLPIVIADQKNRQSFIYIVEPICKQIENLQSKNINLRHTRDFLLPKLISGEIDVENLDIESETTAA